MKCEKCDAEIGADSRFCASCGSKVTRPSERAASTTGVVLDYDRRNSRGLISGSDGYRYPFNIEDWNFESRADHEAWLVDVEAGVREIEEPFNPSEPDIEQTVDWLRSLAEVTK
jgi:hypothetical protein